jgi:hypothetical protein
MKNDGTNPNDRNDKCPTFNSVIPSEVEESLTDLIRFANIREVGGRATTLADRTVATIVARKPALRYSTKLGRVA